ncbi:MAG: tRNA lysidine(34) synthetase TilS [Pyrinomonas sp.]|uniref:tRNA lysidine(34) synthetase TilS n=1 Tax=Pyrinomonas sp. TaxID=2080306 RepID=UPI00332A8C9B
MSGTKPSEFARKLWRELRRLGLDAGRSVIAVSGGSDSVALLLALDELIKTVGLRIEPVVAHLDHALRPTSAEERSAVAELASTLGYECETARIEVERLAGEKGGNLEQAARRARYEFLAETARRYHARAVLVAHTMDDQAETFLLRLIRGSGAEGLSGMARVRQLGPEVLLVRPLLSWARKSATESYCRARGVAFFSDPSNRDERYARARVRHQLIPLLETFNPRVVETLARTADLLREDNEVLAAEATNLLARATASGDGASPLNVATLAAAPTALRRRALRLWIKRQRGDLRRIESVHIAAVDLLLEGERGGRVVELPGASIVERRRGLLFFRRKSADVSSSVSSSSENRQTGRCEK